MPYVKEIWVHPVKSLAGIKLDKVDIDEHGFKYDRKYMIVEPDKKKPNDPRAYRFVTQRELPALSLVQTSYNETTNSLRMHYPKNGSTIEIPLDIPQIILNKCRTIDCFIWYHTISSWDIGDHFPEIKEFFDAIRGTSDRKITIVAPEHRRDATWGSFSEKQVERRATPSFQDFFPGNLITQQSLDDLYGRVFEKTNGEVRVCPRNFRPNIVIDGVSKAWDEDDWKRIRVGEYRWYIPCRNIRCQIPTINLMSGEFEKSREPYKTLQSFRRIDEGYKLAPCFGMNMINESTGFTVQVGDEVEILERGEHKYPAIR
ncbi:hypothetical protein TRVA0_023S00650 [Trichomonascus vanleenenianus]|uniref:MOSC domain-containing protein n=1 Tax=Trichomonascus vanleenenianus TaxID=2268995 RepID=UPI003EC9B53B